MLICIEHKDLHSHASETVTWVGISKIVKPFLFKSAYICQEQTVKDDTMAKCGAIYSYNDRDTHFN